MRYMLLLALALTLCACGHDSTGSDAPVHNVYVVSPSGGYSAASRTFAGIVEERGEVSVGFKTAGQIKQIMVKEGDHVRRGQLLARLDDADYRLGVEALQIQYDQVEGEVARARKLFEKKSMTANDYDKAVAGLKQLGVQLQVNKNKLAYTSLYAPASGVVEAVNYSAGEMVDAGTAVFTMLDMSQKTVVVDIPAAIYMMRADISGVTCVSGHSPADSCRMRVMSIVPKADLTQLYRMRLGFISGGESMTPGMNVEVNLTMDSGAAGAMTLPQSALFRHDGKECVWVVRADSTVVLRPVAVNPAAAAGTDVEILSGLSAADRVVRAGVRMLHEGEKVNIIGEPSATNVGGVL